MVDENEAQGQLETLAHGGEQASERADLIGRPRTGVAETILALTSGGREVLRSSGRSRGGRSPQIRPANSHTRRLRYGRALEELALSPGGCLLADGLAAVGLVRAQGDSQRISGRRCAA